MTLAWWTVQGEPRLAARRPAPAGAPGPRAVHPRVNVYETSRELVLTAELPGVPPGALDLSVDGDRLTLRGERAIADPEGARVHRRERRAGAFERVIALPAEVDASGIQAVYRSGILLVKVDRKSVV